MFDNHIRNVEATVSSMPQIHVALDDFLARLADLDKNTGSQPLVDDDIVNHVK